MWMFAETNQLQVYMFSLRKSSLLQIVFADMTKAFDMVNRERLLYTVKTYRMSAFTFQPHQIVA